MADISFWHLLPRLLLVFQKRQGILIHLQRHYHPAETTVFIDSVLRAFILAIRCRNTVLILAEKSFLYLKKGQECL